MINVIVLPIIYQMLFRFEMDEMLHAFISFKDLLFMDKVHIVF